MDSIDDVAAASLQELEAIAERLPLDIAFRRTAHVALQELWDFVEPQVFDAPLVGLLVHDQGTDHHGLLIQSDLPLSDVEEILRRALLMLVPEATAAGSIAWISFPLAPQLEYITYRMRYAG